jgi:predicted ArsR family transcriptional regulator
MNTADRILYLLKTRGPLTAKVLGDMLSLTSMGARRQLEALEAAGLVGWEERSEGVGRPARYWQLTDAGHARFPDRHADLTVNLIAQVRLIFGDAGLDRLIASREAESRRQYGAAMPVEGSLRDRAQALAALRDAEGYMADVLPQADGSVLLVENHCPICAAARDCQGFCRSELAIFQDTLGPDCQVERTDHLLAGARRCAYRISPVART